MSSVKATTSLPVYAQSFEAFSDAGGRPHDVKDPASLFPMRISATIAYINPGEIIGFTWMKDQRNFKEFEAALNKEYADFERLGTLRLANDVYEDTTYVTYLAMEDFKGFYRCQITDAYKMEGPRKVVLIDYGAIIDVDDGTLNLYCHESMDDPAFAGFCCLADRNQCEQIGAATVDKFSPGEEVDLFLLSSKEPYYAVASSLRNSETKLVEAALINDLPPEFAETWNQISINHFEDEAAVRPTMAFSPRWIHGYFPVLVTVAQIQSMEHIAVADLLCSLRSCILSEYLLVHYSKDEVKQALQVTDPIAELGVGVIVVAHDVKTHRFYRAQIVELNPISNSASLVGLDFPSWVCYEHSCNNLWRLSKTIELFPRQCHNVSIERGLSQSFGVRTMLAELARIYCPSNSIALVQYKEKNLDVELLITVNSTLRSLKDLIGLKHKYFQERVMGSEVSADPSSWKNKKSVEELQNGFGQLSIDKKNEMEAEKVAEAEKPVRGEKSVEAKMPVRGEKSAEAKMPVRGEKSAEAKKPVRGEKSA